MLWKRPPPTMSGLTDIPKGFDDIPFTQAFTIAEQLKLSPEERLIYEGSLKRQRDELTIAYNARQEGIAEGRAEERYAMARALLAKGMQRAFVSEVTQLSAAKLDAL